MLKRLACFSICVVFLTLWSSCRKDFDFAPSNGTLEFSKDTVYLDTVFTAIGSSTYNLKVYNRSNNDIQIPTVRLAQGEASKYRLNIDGIAGKTFENVEILAKDSLFVFVETTVDITEETSENTFLYTDKIEFDSADNQQSVELVTLVQDAIFIYPDKTDGVIETLTLNINGETVETNIQGRYLTSEELTFTDEKPYVVYGYATVPNGETLTVEAGARVHFHANSGLMVTEGASLQVNGALSADQELLENEVVFESDRLEPAFADVPGQWGTIWLMPGSVNNSINHATIKNGLVGVLCDNSITLDNITAEGNQLTITNSQIYNHANFGMLSRNFSITAENVVLNNAGQSSFAGTLGGTYNFTHCTIANYWQNSFRQFPALLLNNFMETEDTVSVGDLEANFNNCIIFGNEQRELVVDELEEESTNFNFKFNNCLLRFQDSSNSTNPNHDFDNTIHYEDLILNQDPDFKNPFKNELLIGENSAANDEGNSAFGMLSTDILGEERPTTSPDLGAYQHTVFEE